MNHTLAIGIGLLLLVVAMVGRWIFRRLTEIRNQKRRQTRTRLRREGPGAFDARAWQNAGEHLPHPGFHRPADIYLNDPGILPPPREIRGDYGE